MTDTRALIDAIHDDRLEAIDDPDAQRVCRNIGERVGSEVAWVVKRLAEAGITATPEGDPGAPQPRHAAVLSLGDAEAALAAAEVLAGEGFLPWEPVSGAGRHIHRRFGSDLTLARTTDVTLVITLRRPSSSPRRLPKALLPTANDFDLVTLPGPLWPLYFIIRPVRLVLERLGLRPRSTRALGPFLSTPDSLIEPLLALAEMDDGDVLVDLGCGDGRILISAARTQHCRGIGIESDPALVARARTAAQDLAQPDRVRIVNDDAMAALDSVTAEGTVFFVFVPAEAASGLIAALLERARPGSVIIAHEQHRLPDPPPGAESFPILTPQGVTVAHRWRVG